MDQDRFLCRGIDLRTQQWITGYLLVKFDGVYIDTCQEFENDGFTSTGVFKVDEESVGKCIGLKAKDGRLIFENYKLRITLPIKNIEKPVIFEGFVKYIESSFRICCSRNENPRIDDFSQDCIFEIIEDLKNK